MRWFVTIAVAAVLASAIVACSSLEDGEESEPTPIPTPTPTPEVEEGKVTKTVVGNTTTFAGKLRGTHDSKKFDIFAKSDVIEVKFDYPSNAAFFVKVLGKTGDEFGEFDLSESEIIELSGGGKFTLIVHSTAGGGRWSATYTE